MEEYIAKISAHGANRYEQWYPWLEYLDKVDQQEIIAGAKTYEKALRKAAVWLKRRLEIQAIAAESCALYEESPERYTEIQNNTELSVSALMK